MEHLIQAERQAYEEEMLRWQAQLAAQQGAPAPAAASPPQP